MFRRCSALAYQVGVHVPHSEAYRGARIKHWPRQQIPANFSMLPEQRWAMNPLPRDTGKVPRNFVLKVLYYQQPCAVDSLWALCTQDSECVLDSKRHLRAVLKQARDEGYITFEKASTAIPASSGDNGDAAQQSQQQQQQQQAQVQQQWMCTLTRERFDEVRAMVNMLPDAAASPISAGMRGEAAAETGDSAEIFRGLEVEDKIRHLERLREQLASANTLLSEYQRIEADYLPYTDLQGKVQHMWWYDSKDAPREVEGGANATTPAAGVPAEEAQEEAPESKTEAKA